MWEGGFCDKLLILYNCKSGEITAILAKGSHRTCVYFYTGSRINITYYIICLIICVFVFVLLVVGFSTCRYNKFGLLFYYMLHYMNEKDGTLKLCLHELWGTLKYFNPFFSEDFFLKFHRKNTHRCILSCTKPCFQVMPAIVDYAVPSYNITWLW